MSTRAVVAAAVLGLTLLAGCGGTPEVSLPTAPPASDGASPTRTLPEVSPPTRTPESPSSTRTRTPEQTEEAETPTEAPTEEQPGTPEAEPTETDTAIALPPAATDTPDRTEPAEPDEGEAEPTTEQPTEAETTPAETTPEESTAEESTAETPPATESSSPEDGQSASPTPAETSDSGTPGWLWVVPVGAAAGGIWWFVMARSRRRRWDESLEVERGQARWLLDTLVPTMVNPTAAASALAVHWDSAQLTLDKLEAGLADLVAAPPDAERRTTAQELAEAVAQLRRAVAADLALRAGTSPIPADPESLGVSAAAVQVARDRLSAALPSLTGPA